MIIVRKRKLKYVKRIKVLLLPKKTKYKNKRKSNSPQRKSIVLEVLHTDNSN